MPGTLSPYNMAGWVILPALPNGNVPAYTIAADGGGAIYYADAIRWHWDVCFTVLGGIPIASDDFDACSQVVDTGGSGGLWDTVPPMSLPGTGTFRQILNGGSWENPDTHQVSTDSQGVSAALGYWLSKNTTRDCENATKDQLWAGSVMSMLQGIADQQFTGLPTPPQPAPPVPAWQQPPWNNPLAHAVQGGLGLFLAQASRSDGYIDAAGRVVLDSIPVP